MNAVKTERTYVAEVDWNWREIVTMIVVFARMILSNNIVQSYDTCGQIISKNAKNVSVVWGGNNNTVSAKYFVVFYVISFYSFWLP